MTGACFTSTIYAEVIAVDDELKKKAVQYIRHMRNWGQTWEFITFDEWAASMAKKNIPIDELRAAWDAAMAESK